MKIITYIRARVRTMYVALRTQIRSFCGVSDTARWGTEANLKSDWDSRTIRMADFIPENSRVLEFGAGRKILQNHLKPGCEYIPSDIVSRGEGTLVCDLNAVTLPEFPSVDVVVLSGVLEYVSQIERLIRVLTPKTGMIITSYAIREDTGDRSKDAIMERRSLGWVNDYTRDEFIALFTRHGFQLSASDTWRTQEIFVFVK